MTIYEPLKANCRSTGHVTSPETPDSGFLACQPLATGAHWVKLRLTTVTL